MKRVIPVTVKFDEATLKRLDQLITMARLAHPGHDVTRGSMIRHLIDEKARRARRASFNDTEA